MVTDYDRVAAAIEYLRNHAGEQPRLNDVAGAVHVSPFHFQRLFKRWAGVSPKQFLTVLTVDRAKTLLASDASILDAALEVGLSSSSRLHDHFVSIDAVTPGEYKQRGAGLAIAYGRAESPFGEVWAASTERGILSLVFTDAERADPLERARAQWPEAQFSRDDEGARIVVDRVFARDAAVGRDVRVRVRGTNFQVRVWQALLQIPAGQTVSYSGLAKVIGAPNSARAVGNALAANPVAYAIPCHRVLTGSGAPGGYRWHPERKRLMLAWERGAWR